MAIDYSNRRQVSRNRPKRTPVRPFLFLATGGVIVVYGLGLITGWLIFGKTRHSVQAAVQKTNPAQGEAVPNVKPQSPAGAQTGVPTPQLTFYDSLPNGEKGGKGLIGSGLNPQRDEERVASGKNLQQPANSGASKPEKTAATPDPQSQSPAEVKKQRKPAPEARSSADTKTAAAEKPVPEVKKPASAPASYAVQLGSYHDRKEAEDLKAKWAKNGYSARIVETSVPGKGTLYRVRIGNHMTKEAASQLSGKIGSGAIPFPEQARAEAKTEKR